jgi:hypothetical protein
MRQSDGQPPGRKPIRRHRAVFPRGSDAPGAAAAPQVGERGRIRPSDTLARQTGIRYNQAGYADHKSPKSFDQAVTCAATAKRAPEERSLSGGRPAADWGSAGKRLGDRAFALRSRAPGKHVCPKAIAGGESARRRRAPGVPQGAGRSERKGKSAGDGGGGASAHAYPARGEAGGWRGRGAGFATGFGERGDGAADAGRSRGEGAFSAGGGRGPLSSGGSAGEHGRSVLGALGAKLVWGIHFLGASAGHFPAGDFSPCGARLSPAPAAAAVCADPGQ